MPAYWFKNREDEFNAWCVNHPLGFLVNAHYKSRPRYLFLHKVGCTSFAGKSNFTRPRYSKLCSDSIDELRAMIQRDVGASDFSNICKLCFPSSGNHAVRSGDR